MLVKNTKVCRRCKQEKFISEFGKSASRKDGLQHWCKAYLKEANKKRIEKIKKQKRNTKLKRLSHYHLVKGLQYRFKDPMKKNATRDIIIYKCLDCGKEVESTLELAWEHRFKCEQCASKGIATPLFLINEQEKQEHSCNCCSNHKDKNEQQEVGFVQYTPNSIDEQIKIVIVPIPQYVEEPKKEKKGIFNWFKKLFH